MPYQNDDSIGPVVRGCRNDFDFTALFEQVIFTISPACIYILFSAVSIRKLVRRPRIVDSPLMAGVELLLACSNACLKLVVLILGSKGFYRALTTRSVSVAAEAVDLTAAICLIAHSWLNCSRSPRPSFVIETYLASTLLFDIAYTRTAWLLTPDHVHPVYTRFMISATVNKAVLLLIESFPKTRWLTWDRKNVSPEEMSGFYSLSVFAWLYRLFMQGYKGILSLDSLYHLDHTIATESLASRFQDELQKHSLKDKNWSLTEILIRTLHIPLLLPIGPRIVLIGASFCQPFLIESLLEYLQKGAQDKRVGYSFICATILIYGSIAISTSLYWYFQERFIIKLRGCLVSAIYSKKTELKLSVEDDSSVVTLMSIDVERTMIGILDIHEYWANCIQVAVACWLLQAELGKVFVVPIVVVLISVLLAALASKLVSPRQRAWMAAIQTRVAVTANAITHLKLIKMSGMIRPVRSHIQHLRIKELKLGGRWRIILAFAASISQIPLLLSPVLTFAFTPKTLDTSTIFVSIAYLTLLASPLLILLQKLPQLLSALTCLQRIQAFLVRESRVDYRFREQNSEKKILPDVALVAEIIDIGHTQANVIRPQSSVPSSITISRGSFGWSEDIDTLTNVNVRIPKSQLTVIVGPVASGKSTLCKAILGEVPFMRGTVSISQGMKIGYCDQQPFLYNSTIRANIIGFTPFAVDRYNEVVRATMLHEDLSTLPLHDQTLIGGGGIALSGGQRQRLSIARALYQTGVDILIFDDVLSGLDANTEDRVFNQVFGTIGLLRRRHATTVLCTHNPRRLIAANHIIRLESDGSVIEDKQRCTAETQDAVQLISQSPTNASQNPSGFTPSASSLFTAMDNISPPSDKDSVRQTGDIAVYKHYLGSIGILPLGILLFAGICFGFLSNFPRVWLTYWSQDLANLSGPIHSQAYYIGIYALLQVTCLMSFIAAALIVLVVFIRQSGSILHHRMLETLTNATLRLSTLIDVGVLTNLFSQDINLIDSELPISLVNIILDLTNVIGIAALLASSSPWLMLAYPGLLAVLWFIQHFYLRTSRQIRLLDLEAKSPLYSHFLDTVKGITTVRAFGWVGESVARSNVLLDQSQRATYLRSMIQRWLYFTLSMVVLVIATTLVALITQIGAGSNITGASLVTLMTLSQSLVDIIQFYAALETSIGSVARLRNFTTQTDLEKKPENDVEPVTDWPSRGEIVIKNAWASYTKGQSEGECSLRGLNMTLQAGQKVALCGRTGSGKSSVILLLLGFLDLISRDENSSALCIDEQPLTSVERQTLRERLITIPQDPVFLPPGSTIAQNLDPLGIASTDQCKSVLEDIGFWLNMGNLNKGLCTELSSTALSQGQRQLFNLARAVLKRRTSHGSVVLLDEFTSSVDAATERKMMDIVFKEFHNCTIVMVSHRLDMVIEMFDRVVVLDRGRIVESGNPRVLCEAPESWFARLVKASEAT